LEAHFAANTLDFATKNLFSILYTLPLPSKTAISGSVDSLDDKAISCYVDKMIDVDDPPSKIFAAGVGARWARAEDWIAG